MSICTVCGLAACGLASHQQIAKSDSIDQAMQQVRIAKAQEAREDLEIIAKVVRQHHPQLSEAQVVSKALEAHPELYEQMVGG